MLNYADKMKVVCIVAAAGRGRRLGFKKDKPFILLGGKPLLAHTLKALEGCVFIDYIVVAVSRNKLKTCERLVKKYRFDKIRIIVQGGKRRFDSVKNALTKIGNADFVLIHDGVRPFINENLIKKVFSAAKRFDAAICATPAKQTIKIADKNLFAVSTPNRKLLWKAQTPQAFKRNLIIKAYKKTRNKNATDDSSLVEELGHKVKIIEGSHRNIKITTREDLELARILVE